MGITIKDVARMANTSIATVSRVLSSKPGVSESTRQRVQEIIDQTGFRPSIVAQNLALKKGMNLGFIASNLANFIYVEVFRGLEKHCRNAGYQLLLMDSEEDIEKEKESVELMRQNHVQGLIVIPVHDYDTHGDVDHLLRLKLAKFPFVLMGSVEGYGFDCVTMEEHDAAMALTDQFLAHGHKRFAFLGYVPNNRCVRERLDGVRDALAKHGLEIDPNHIVTMDREFWFKEAKDLMAMPESPTAMVVVNGSSALFVMQELKECGYSIPQDVSVGGFGDLFAAQMIQPPLTTLVENESELSRVCFELLMKRIKDPQRMPEKILVPASLLVRGSIGPCPNR